MCVCILDYRSIFRPNECPITISFSVTVFILTLSPSPLCVLSALRGSISNVTAELAETAKDSIMASIPMLFPITLSASLASSTKSLILCPRYTCVKGNDCLYLYGMRFFDRVRRWLKGIQVYALVGESGTGKSFRAKLVAQKYRIDLIIDDGLVIKDDKIIAGYSA